MPTGIGIRTPESTIEPVDAICISPPIDSTGLEAWVITNSFTSPTTTDTSKVLRNYAKGKPNFVKVGSPVISAESTKFTALSHYLETSIPDTANFTFFIVCKSSDTQAANATRVSFYGNDVNAAVGGGGNTFGVSLRAASATSLALICARGTVASPITGTVTLTGHNFSNYSLIWGRCNGGVTELHNVTQSLNVVSGTYTEPRLLGTLNMRIGSGRSSQTGFGDIRDVVHFGRSLSDVEVNAMIADIRAKCSARGITV